MLRKKIVIQIFYQWKEETLLNKIKKRKNECIKSIFIDFKNKKRSLPSSPQIRNQTNNGRVISIKPLENTSKKNDSVLHESKQSLNLSELKEEINQDRIETSRNSLNLSGNLLKRRVMTCEDGEKENRQIIKVKSRSFFKNRRYKNKETNDSFNFPQPVKTLI